MQAFVICSAGSNFGTAFLVRWRNCLFILTNNHVLPSIEAAMAAVLEFRAVQPIVRVKLAPQVLFHTSSKSALDFSLVAISAESLADISHIQPLELSDESLLDELEVQIVGHPKGSLCVLCFRNNHVT
jgi:hypothetical protein